MTVVTSQYWKSRRDKTYQIYIYLWFLLIKSTKIMSIKNAVTLYHANLALTFHIHSISRKERREILHLIKIRKCKHLFSFVLLRDRRNECITGECSVKWVTRKIMLTREQELRSAVTVDCLHEKRSFRGDRFHSTIHNRELNTSRCCTNSASFCQVPRSIDCHHSRVAARIGKIAIAASRNCR